MTLKGEHLAAGALLLGGAAFLIGGLRQSGGAKAPAQRPTTEALWDVPEPVQRVLCMPEEHYGDVVYTKHRYPDRVGGELSTVIHYGHSALNVPNVKDKQWITCPPSEAIL